VLNPTTPQTIIVFLPRKMKNEKRKKGRKRWQWGILEGGGGAG